MKVILAVLDGVGYRKETNGNAVKNADMKNFNFLLKEYPNSLLEASGEYVGLPKGQMGNSEVGHLAIGSGKKIKQSLERINSSIKNKEIYDNNALNNAIDHAKKNNSRLHVIGLLSDGGVHSHIDHIFSILDVAKEKDLQKVYVHVITDGRDTHYKSALKYINELDKKMQELNLGKIATIGGRYFAMDRDRFWDRTKLYYDAIVNGIGESSKSYIDAINDSYEKNITDEFIKPTILDIRGMINDNDSIVFANFRSDRIIQILSSFTEGFKDFNIKKLNNLKIITMDSVGDRFEFDSMFDKISVNNTLGEVLSQNNIRSLRVAEVSKQTHVTHFFDGDKDIKFPITYTVIVDKKNVETYDLAPEMSAKEITDVIKENIKDVDFVFVNYANGDMVGHTGNYQAGIKAMEALDKEIGRLYSIAKGNNFLLILTADHGNIEEMIYENGDISTTHTNNKVYFVVCDKNYEVKDGALYDIAPSILNLYRIDKKDMDGDLIIRETE